MKDEGHLTSRSHLPVTQLNFGNVFGSGKSARFQLGPIYCSGSSHKGGRGKIVPQSCKDIWQQGKNQV